MCPPPLTVITSFHVSTSKGQPGSGKCRRESTWALARTITSASMTPKAVCCARVRRCVVLLTLAALCSSLISSPGAAAQTLIDAPAANFSLDCDYDIVAPSVSDVCSCVKLITSVLHKRQSIARFHTSQTLASASLSKATTAVALAVITVRLASSMLRWWKAQASIPPAKVRTCCAPSHRRCQLRRLSKGPRTSSTTGASCIVA